MLNLTSPAGSFILEYICQKSFVSKYFALEADYARRTVNEYKKLSVKPQHVFPQLSSEKAQKYNDGFDIDRLEAIPVGNERNRKLAEEEFYKGMCFDTYRDEDDQTVGVEAEYYPADEFEVSKFTEEYSSTHEKTCFQTLFARRKWVITLAVKNPERAFYANDIIRWQYIILAQDKEIFTNIKYDFLACPSYIDVTHIVNSNTLSFLKNNKDNNLTPTGFLDALLERTAIGKMVKRVLDDFGLQADSVLVFDESEREYTISEVYKIKMKHEISLRFKVSPVSARLIKPEKHLMS